MEIMSGLKKKKNEERIESIIAILCLEFGVEKEDILKTVSGGENVLKYMAIFMATEMTSLSLVEISKILQERSPKAVSTACDGLKKYFKFIPGLEEKYEKIKIKAIERGDGF